MSAINITEQPGARLIDGSDINTIIAAVNALAAGTTTGAYTGGFTLSNGLALKTDTVADHTGLIQAYDVDNATYKTFGTLTNGDTPSFALAAPSGGSLTIDGAVIGGTTPAAVSGTTGTFSGNLSVTTATSTLVLKQGANGKTGTFTLNGATPVSVSNTSVTANSVVILTLKTVSGTVSPSAPNVQTITPSTGFTVAGTAGDTSVYNYHIIESAA